MKAGGNFAVKGLGNPGLLTQFVQEMLCSSETCKKAAATVDKFLSADPVSVGFPAVSATKTARGAAGVAGSLWARTARQRKHWTEVIAIADEKLNLASVTNRSPLYDVERLIEKYLRDIKIIQGSVIKRPTTFPFERQAVATMEVILTTIGDIRKIKTHRNLARLQEGFINQLKKIITDFRKTAHNFGYR